MNKSILKHEIRSMKWMLLLSIIGSLFITIMFSIYLDTSYGDMFSRGIRANEAMIQTALRYISNMILTIFTILSIIQIFMQFRSEKDPEIGRFLGSLPVRKEEFFKIKLVTGIMNLSLAFIVLAIGIIIVRSNNMFWVQDIYSISIISGPFIEADGIVSLLKEIGLIYLIILSFYTFLFMVQYTFTNVVGGIVTGFLVWLAPVFILYSSMFTLEKLTSTAIARGFMVNGIMNYMEWLLPWIYPFGFDYKLIVGPKDVTLGNILNIEGLWIKYIIVAVLILVNIFIGDKFNKKSKVENENMVIPFKATRNIFKVGVAICSGLLVSTILSEIMRIQISNIIHMVFIVLGGFIGYFISKRIAGAGIK